MEGGNTCLSATAPIAGRKSLTLLRRVRTARVRRAYAIATNPGASVGRVILALILLILALSALASAASDSNPNGRLGGFVIALGLGLGGAALLLSGLRRYFGAGMSSPRPPTAMKKCPFCAEDIRIAAIVCKHCGRDVPTAAAEVQIAQTKKKSLPVARGCAIFVILSSV